MTSQNIIPAARHASSQFHLPPAASRASLKDATATTSGAIAKAATTDEQEAGRQCSEATGASTSRGADAKKATADDQEARRRCS